MTEPLPPATSTTSRDVPLRTESNSAGKYIGLLVFAVIWTGIAGTVLYASSRDGELMGIVCPGIFVLIGVVLFVVGTVGIVSRSMVRRRVDAAVVRISRQPLRLGETFRVDVSQQCKRPITLESLRIRFYGEEWVEYQKGTTTYHDTHKFQEQEVIACENIAVQPGMPVVGSAEFTIPADSMHTFKSADNKVQWWVEVKTCLQRCPDDEQRFEVHVVPRLLSPPMEEPV